MKKTFSNIRKCVIISLSAIGSILLIVLVILLITFGNELRSLNSIKKLDDYPLYQMTYYGDYDFDKFLENGGAKNNTELGAFIRKNLSKGFSFIENSTPACTVAVSRNKTGDVILGRNFDYDYAPSLLLKTKPKNGYASISLVNLTFCGYTKENFPAKLGLSVDSFASLASPYLPYDGMNEKGVAIAILEAPYAGLPEFDENKSTLNNSTLIRLVLDKATTVDEAIQLLKNYNIYFGEGIACHYIIADKLGNSVVVEWLDGEIKVTPEKIAANFIAYEGNNSGYGLDRYETIKREIENHGGTLSETEMCTNLKKVGNNCTQWSVVYNLSTLKGEVFVGGNLEKTYILGLK